MEKEMKVLFIGNSYTFYYDMPEALFYPMMQEAGVQLSVERITKGSQRLINSANPEDVLGEKVDAALKNHSYDLVILQEQSLLPLAQPGAFYDGVRRLYARIRGIGAKAFLYSTWSRKEGSNELVKRGLTCQEMTERLAAGYTAIGEELGIPVAYVGKAFSYVIEACGDRVELYNEDKSHPSYAGSFLAALTLTAAVTGKDPTDLKYLGELDVETAGILKAAARRAVMEPVVIPEKYQTRSEGVVYVPEENQ
ncbi:MAG: hypothetical protein IKJ74_03520 [Clostridia bacterium]|nr:hypothetical protein [Clostridia bacterium]